MRPKRRLPALARDNGDQRSPDLAMTDDSPLSARWVGSWACAPQLVEPGNLPPAPGLAGNTLRQTLLTTLAGRRVRLLFSNEWGDAPVTFQSVRLAHAKGASAIEPSTDRQLSFAGKAAVTIPPGQTLVSDPLDFPSAALGSLALSIYFGAVPRALSGHPSSRTTVYLQHGNAASAASLPEASTTEHWYFIVGLEVEAHAPAAAIVTLGDSITGGRGSTTNGNNRWPDQLARRLQAHSSTAAVAVLNQGIGGNAVLRGGLGPPAIARFERDVLGQRGARWLILLAGVNDIGGSTHGGVASELIEAYKGMIDRAHARGLLVYGVPILPFGGSQYDSPEHEAARQTVNEWVRKSRRFDAVVDLDRAVADPQRSHQLLPAYDCGDHLHLSVAGYQA
ncbi:MAG TPA: SGNH/GDSL hydrolase family protein, partial [Polyangiaceae bacterium]